MSTNSARMIVSEQWVHLIEYCSYKSKHADSIAKESHVNKLCQATDANFGENDNLWDFSNDRGWILLNDNREECLTVSFETPVFINEINIYESLNPGGIIKLETLESQRDKWWTLWHSKSNCDKKTSSPNLFKPLLRHYRFRSNTLRITLDPRHADRIGIQAIKLIGSNIFNTDLHRITILQAMMNLYQEVLNGTKLDVQFLIDDQTINAHRNILCCRSSYFRILLLNDFSERTQTEPIKLTDIDYETFIELLFFIYTGTYHKDLSYELAIKCMIYSDKINLLTGKNAALEIVSHHLSRNHASILSMYRLIKEKSPAFDDLLDYIYDLCAKYMNEVCKQQEFYDLDKDLIVDLICQSSQRRTAREPEINKQTAN